MSNSPKGSCRGIADLWAFGPPPGRQQKPYGKGARLWLRPERRSASGKLISRASWLILDVGRHIATRCAAGEIAAAQARLAEYIAAKYRPRCKELEALNNYRLTPVGS
jgi:hypothetical protein